MLAPSSPCVRHVCHAPRLLLLLLTLTGTLFLGEANRHIFNNVESNIKVWEEQGEGALGKRAEELKNGPPKKKPAA